MVTNKKAAEWEEAKKKCKLNAETLGMAKGMGLNPRSLIKNIPNKSEQWKAPVSVWIQEMYEERQSKAMKKKIMKEESSNQGNTTIYICNYSFSNKGTTKTRINNNNSDNVINQY